MKIVVLKFGVHQLGQLKRSKKLQIIRTLKKSQSVVISYMSGVTNEFIRKSREISNNFSESEYDALISSGEQVACSLIAGRLSHIELNHAPGRHGKFQF